MNHVHLTSTLKNWVADKQRNGIRQHEPAWYAARVNTISGSILSTVMGKNPYQNIAYLISEKIGLSAFKGDIKTQWGNLFEDVLKAYVEIDKHCEILGTALLVEGPPYTCYSPDGLAVIEVCPGAPQIVLCEFKCPFSRLPAAGPPKYYIPQVKMGLDVLQLPTIGLLAEGVFRRCAWDDLGFSSAADTSLVDTLVTTSGPIACGFIGLFGSSPQVDALYSATYASRGTSANDYFSNDLGLAPSGLITAIIKAFAEGQLKTHYAPIILPHDDCDSKLVAHLEDYMKVCRGQTPDTYNYGLLPWKLFSVNYNYIEKEQDYLKPWLPKIKEIIELVIKCNDPANHDIKLNIYNSYLKKQFGSFDDEW